MWYIVGKSLHYSSLFPQEQGSLEEIMKNLHEKLGWYVMNGWTIEWHSPISTAIISKNGSPSIYLTIGELDANARLARTNK